MLVVVLGGLLFLPLGFVLVVTTFAIFGVWEIFRALEASGTRLPIIPVMVGTVAMPLAAYFGGSESLLFAMLLSSVAVLLWRSLEGAAGSARSIFAGVFTMAWVPFLISFAVLPLHASGGETPVGLWPDGYSAGRVAGRHTAAAGGLQRHFRLPGGRVPGQAPDGPEDQSRRRPGRASPAPLPVPW